jgi:hypothetical protein
MPTPAMKLLLVLALAACGAPNAPSKTTPTPAPSTTSASASTVDDRPPCPDRVIIQDDLRLLPRVPECVKNKDEPLVDATPAFDEMTKLMTEYPKLEIGIVGHASEDEKDPDALAEARARRFRDELVKRGVSAARLDVHGVGTKRPLDVRDQRKNRYVSVVIIRSFGQRFMTWNGTDYENVPFVPDPNAKPCRKDAGAP